ncbi:L-lactate dehydrogenase [Ditylenchus destructor]|uniref:L-lactate dehydrogenase n=1 Tax=Ditylenchus destructor TaxID=166010 RepID=A0AAD4MW07_9BILA|nr:L-lactate dehydrogenase [Ditylenchus destructor]
MNPEIGHRDENDHWEEGIHQRVIQSAYEGVHGIAHDVYLSSPSVLGANGLTHIVNQNLLPKEREQLHKPAEEIAKIQADFEQYEKDSRIAIPMIMPVALGTIGHGSLMAGIEDCEEQCLKDLFDFFGVDHLQETEKEFWNLQLEEFPAKGMIYQAAQRFIIPLAVKSSYKEAKTFIVFFILDTGAFLTQLTENTIDTIFGQNKFTQRVFIQGHAIHCQRAATIGDKNFSNINLIGSDFMRRLNLSIVTSPHAYRNIMNEEVKIFYIAPHNKAIDAVKMADLRDQTPNIRSRIHTSFANSDPVRGYNREKQFVAPQIRESEPRSEPSIEQATPSTSDINVVKGPEPKQRRLESGGKTDNP